MKTIEIEEEVKECLSILTDRSCNYQETALKLEKLLNLQ